MSTPETDLLFEKFLQDKGYVSVQGAQLTGMGVGSAGPGAPKFPVPQVKMSGVNLGAELDNQFDNFIQGKGWAIRDELTQFDKAQEITRRRDAIQAKAAEATAKAELPGLVQKEFSPMTSEEDRPFMPRLKQVGTETDPKTGNQVPILKFRPPTPEEKSTFHQLWDEIKWRTETPEGALQTLNDRMAGVTAGNVNLDKMIAWAKGERGQPATEQATAERLAAEQKSLGYIPWAGKVIASSFEGLQGGALAYGVMGGAGAAVGRGVLGGAKVAPIISRIVVPSIFQGTITGLATKPEEDSLDARLKSVPMQILYWAAFNTVGLGIEKLTDLINWNVQYRDRIAGTGPRGGFGAAQGIKVEPEFAPGAEPQIKTSFTQAEIRDIYNKQGSLESDFLRRTGMSEHDFRLKMSQDPRGTLQAMGLSPMEAEVYASISDASLWKEARLRGWIPDKPIEFGAEPTGYRVTRTGAVSPSTQVAGEPEVAIPIKPSWGDVFRKTPAGYPEPGIVGNAPGEMPPVTPPGVLGGAVPAGEAPRPTTRSVSAQELPAVPGAAKVAVPEPPPIPAGAEQRDWGIKNQAKREIIDKAIKGTADQYEMDLARGFLEDPKLEGVGNALLSNIVERVKNPPYTIRFDVRDMKGLNTKYGHDKVDELILKPIQDELATHNSGNNPLDWKTMRIGGDEFQGYGYNPKEAEEIGRGVYRRLQGVNLPGGEKIYLDYGIGTTPEEADKNLFLFKDANKAPGATVDEATKAFSETTTEPIAVKHWTKPDNVNQIYEKGFNTKLPPVHGAGGFRRAGYKSSDKFGRGVLYFSADDARWKTAHEHVGEGNGNVDNIAWDNQDQKYVTEVKALKTLDLSPIEANIKPGARMLVIDSLKKYLDVQRKLLKRAYIKDEMPAFVKAVKKAGYDALRVKDNPGQWNRPNTNESVYGDATGRGGKDDFFIFNRDVLEIPEQGKYRARKIFKSRILAQQKRGRVGLPKNAPKLWKDIMAITGGTGIKPWMNDFGRPREEWKLIPQVLKNKGGWGYDEISDALERDYGYKFDTEDLFSLLQQSDKDWAAGQGSDLVDQEARADAEAADRSQADYEHLQEEINRLKNRGESDDAFWGRMTKEASESGFGEDVYGYADSQMKLYKAPGEVQFGEETAFSVRRQEQPLPPQQKIPEKGTFTAIRTDDGGIYFDKNFGNHYELVMELKIPPERVVGGGFIRDGVYEESPYSDARRIGMNARADLGMPEPSYSARQIVPQRMSTGRTTVPQRARIRFNVVNIQDAPEWAGTLKGLDQNPLYKDLVKTIRALGLKPLDVGKMDIKIDENYSGPRIARIGNALHLVSHDSVLQLMSRSTGIPYGTLHGILSRNIEGEVVESEYDRSTGNVGLNYNLIDMTGAKNPGSLALSLRDLAAHELAHYRVPLHDERYTQELADIYRATNDLMDGIYKISYASMGFEYQPRDLVPITTKNGQRMVAKNLVKIYGQKQMAFNFEKSEETNGDKSIFGAEPRTTYSIRRAKQEGRGLFEEPVGAGGGPGGNRPGQHGETGGLGDRSLLEQPHPSGHGAALPGGVGVQPEPGGLTPPEEKPAPFRPEVPYAPREGEAPAQGVLPMPDAGPLFSAHEGIPPQQQLVNDVYRLTSGDNFPKTWAGDTPEQIQDNRQNLALYSMEHYKPSAGTLEHYVNNIKKFFRGGEMPTGQETSENLRRKLQAQMPQVTGKEGTLMEAEFPTTASAFGEETGPKNKPPAEPEYLDQGMPREKAFEEEEVQILNLFRSTAKGAAPRDAAMEARYLDVMKSRLLPTLPESFSSIGKRLGISKAQAIADYQKLFGLIKESDAVKEMIKRHMRTANLGPIPNEEDLRRLGLWMRKYFSTTRGATAEIDRQNDERLGSRMAEIFDQTLDSHILKKFVDAQPTGVDDYLVKLMRGEITGNGYNDISNSALPAEIKGVMLRVRRRIDSLSELIIAHGGLPDQTKAAFERNLSKYLSRAYRLYQDKHWNPTAEQRAGFAGWLQRTYSMTPEETDTYIEAELAKGRNNQGIAGSRSKRIPQGNFRHLQQLSPEWKAFAGEINRVPWLTMHTITHMATEATNAKFLTWMSGHLPDLWTGDFAEAAKRGWQNSQIPNSQAWGALRGKWVSPELKEYIDREVNYVKSEMEEAIQKIITNPFKWTKTIGSWPTHMRNLLGNTMFSPLVGNSITNPLNWKYYRKSIEVHAQKNVLMRDAWKDLIRHGVTETQFYGSEIPRMHESIMNFEDPEWYEKIWDKMIKLPLDKLGEFYNFEDSWYRVAAFYKLTDPKGKNMSPQEAVSEINAGLQNYRKLPLVVDWLRRWPVLGPFISFKYNTMVIVGKQARKGYEETRNPATRARGYGRLIRLGLILALPTILSEVSKRYFNVDEDKIRELEAYYPQYRRNGTFIYFRNSEGKLKVFDMSYINPFGDLERYLNATIGRALRGDRVDIVGLQDAMDFFSLPLLDAWQIAIKGTDPTFGTKYNSVVDRAKALIAYLYLPASMPLPNFQGLMQGEKYGPATIEATDEKGRIIRKPNPEGGNLRPGAFTGPQFKAIIDAYNGNPDRYGRVKHLTEEIKNFFTGIRTWDVDPAKLLVQAIVQKRSELSDAQNELKTWMTRNQTAPDWELQNHIKSTNDTIVGINKEVEKIMKLSALLEKDGFTATKDRW